MADKYMTCIECPNGCQLKVRMNGDKIEEISGNLCPRGKTYAQTELTDPRRIVTSTVRTSTGGRVPVKTAKPIRKGEIFEVMKKIKALVVTPPVKVGDVLIERVDGEIDLVATGSAE